MATDRSWSSFFRVLMPPCHDGLHPSHYEAKSILPPCGCFLLGIGQTIGRVTHTLWNIETPSAYALGHIIERQ